MSDTEVAHSMSNNQKNIMLVSNVLSGRGSGTDQWASDN